MSLGSLDCIPRGERPVALPNDRHRFAVFRYAQVQLDLPVSVMHLDKTVVRLALKLEALGVVAPYPFVNRSILLPHHPALGLPRVGAVGLGRLSHFEDVAPAVDAPLPDEGFGRCGLVRPDALLVPLAVCNADFRLAVALLDAQLRVGLEGLAALLQALLNLAPCPVARLVEGAPRDDAWSIGRQEVLRGDVEAVARHVG